MFEMAMKNETNETRSTDPRREGARRAASATWTRNRRRSPRVAACGLASHLQTEHASTPGLAVENISMGGLFVRSTTPLKVGTPVMLQLVRPGLKRPLQLTGAIASIVSPAEARLHGTVAGMGVSLDAVEGDLAECLHDLIEDLAATNRAARLARGTVVERPVAPVAQPVAETTADAKDARIILLEEELRLLKKELLRRNRTVGELASKIALIEGRTH
jgi:Tfp pilus assembly protein PilZ